MPLVRYGTFAAVAVQCKKMDSDQILSLRTPCRRRLVILAQDFRIISAEQGGSLDDALFGFGANAACLPEQLEHAVKRVTRAWTPLAQNEQRTVMADGVAMRVFPLLGAGAGYIGVLLEQYHVRRGDPVSSEL